MENRPNSDCCLWILIRNRRLSRHLPLSTYPQVDANNLESTIISFAKRGIAMGDGQTRDVAARLHSASIRLLRTLRREDDGSGLSAPRLSALSWVALEGPVSLADLAHAEQVRPPTMSRIVDALVKRGLVSRVPDPRDRRSVRI